MLQKNKLKTNEFQNYFKQQQGTLEQDIALASQKDKMLLNELEKFKASAAKWEIEKIKLNRDLSQAETNLSNLSEKLEHQTKELEKLQEKFQKEFQLIADKILKDNANELSQQHQKELQQLLQPLKEKIKSFEDNIEKKYIDETKERTNLKAELSKLLELNTTLNLQAQNLTTALKGENKTQGNWGEMILERILESSGLQKGEEYLTQVSDTNAEGRRIQPDVIVNLPENKHLIIDSKVSLVAYESFISSSEVVVKESSMKSHLLSIRTHIKTLNEKNYQSASKLQSPDFVLLFMPIEAAFSLALQHDSELFNYAWERKVVLVSPTTLLASLRTISSVWKNERQTKNAQDIAEKAGNLYDKFVGFLKDMENIDKSLKSAQNHYNEAFNKLGSGRGNLVKRAEQLKELGAKTNKSIPSNLLDES
ncbi:MAG: DNA recombination protein RmuC [Vicingaceae bacterium]|jgi:DNA recombination protein RmuC